VNNGREITERLGLDNITFIEKSVGQITEQAAYDLVFSIDVLEHIVDDVGVLRLFHQALKPGGYLLLHLPRRHQDHRRILDFMFKNHTTPDHVRDEYTSNEIQKKLIATDFEPVSIRYGFSLWGELAFELNYLFWWSGFLRTFAALVTHPLAVWLAYMDTRQDYVDGNSLLVLARPIHSQ
jgi:SAM-dependent methyltransferase